VQVIEKRYVLERLPQWDTGILNVSDKYTDSEYSHTHAGTELKLVFSVRIGTTNTTV